MRFLGMKESRLLDCKNAKITETYYHGAVYNREMIMQEVVRLQRLFSSKEFQVSIPYHKPMSGNQFGSADPISLYALSDTYDGSQFPDDGSLDSNVFNSFWYI